MSTTEVYPQHIQWALALWDPESTSFGPFRNSIHVSPITTSICLSCQQVKYLPLSSFLILYYSPYLRRKHLFCLRFPFRSQFRPDMTKLFVFIVSAPSRPHENYVLPIPSFSLVELLCLTLCYFPRSPPRSIFRRLTVFNTPSCVPPPSLFLYPILSSILLVANLFNIYL